MKLNKREILYCVTIVIAALIFGAPRALSAKGGDVRIAIVTSDHARPYEETLDAFLGHLKKEGLEYVFDVYLMEGKAERSEKIVKDIKDKKATLVFAIGSLATYSVLKKIEDIPVISGVVLREDEFEKNKNATGVSLQFPLEIQFRRITRVMPDAKNIGVLYNPVENKGKIEEARNVARKLGLRLYAEKVDTPQDIPSSLERLEKRADVLWALPDKLVLNSKTAKHILLFCFRNRIPFVGLSAAWVKAGALFALDCDYRDIGVQCAEMALRIIQGAPVTSIKPSHPRKVTYSLNLKTAEVLKIDIPKSVRDGAAQIF